MIKKRERFIIVWWKEWGDASSERGKWDANECLCSASRVSHPNILQLIDTFETRKEFYIIQEL